MEDETLNWVSTNYSDESDVRVGPFVGLQVYIFGASWIVGFLLTYLLIKKLSWPLMTSCLIGSIAPIIVTIILIKLVVNKPEGYWLNWFEDRIVGWFDLDLAKLDQKKGGRK